MQNTLQLLLQEAMGLDVTSIGASAVERAVRVRMHATNHSDMQAYLDLVSGSETELQQLIETIVVPETWFWRDRQAFALLARWALESWLPNNPQGALRMLSLPCSTGEEPYSMVMTLLDAGFPPGRLHIDAIDISQRSLAVARRAVYGKNSFRGTELDVRGRHFDATAAGWQVREAVRAPVRFQQGNMFDEDLLPNTACYHVIFCRNLFIYFDRATQDRAIAVLDRLLTPQALVFVAPSETGLLRSHGYEPIKASLAFAFKKGGVSDVAKQEVVRPLGRPQPLPARRPTASARAEPRVVAPANGLEEAIELADAGRSAEAATLCAEHVRKFGPTARAFRLTGMIRAQEGDLAAAAAAYRSALYLDPADYETLIHLGLLLKKLGDSRGAEGLFRRAQRIETRDNGISS
jgi:chemotaxis protein methyltransferase WspC